MFTNDSSRKILQLLFNEELSAAQIAQKSNISLQLVKYHLDKLQSLDVVKISKIEKNSKSQDMKIYTALKFSIVIVPPALSEKTKESKSLARSFRYIYKVAGLGIATGFSGLLSLLQIPQDKQIIIDNKSTGELALPGDSGKISASSGYLSDESASMIESESPMNPLDSKDLKHDALEVVDTIFALNDIVNSTSELFVPLAIVTVILGGLTVYYLYKSFKKI
ncbi:MAG: winged helix-turn-helix transcriptional regulator [Nitrosopumilus sp.]|nr:MAG: winged helix-turn-helix transcriptional regulator [Nitrosopumilus sp.]